MASTPEESGPVAWSERLEDMLSSLPNQLSGSILSSLIRTTFPTSTAAAKIDVGGDPALCSSCRRLLYGGKKLKSSTIICASFDRLKASASLGCYLCRILFNAEWTPRSECRRENLPVVEHIKDLAAPPQIFTCSIDRVAGSKESGCYVLEALGTIFGSETQIWLLKLLLLPERALEGSKLNPISNTRTASDTAALANSWVQDCTIHHAGCHPLITTWKPTRLIYVGRPDAGIRARLCNSSDIPTSVPYITLSHCWGSADIFKLVSSNLQALMDQIPLSKLTRNFRNAIDLTRRLGVEYVWIDSLCIIQDSKDDWQHESATMRVVYKNAWCCIAAAGFHNGSVGFYNERDASAIVPQKFPVKIPDPDQKEKGGASQLYYLIEDYWHSDIEVAPLNQRAWVYQERSLSPRILHIGARQMFWECSELNACEVFPTGLPAPLQRVNTARLILYPVGRTLSRINVKSIVGLGVDRSSVPGEQNVSIGQLLLRLWQLIVSEYNTFNLTRYEDKLVAISGLAIEMQTLTGDEYVAGMWKSRLIQQLLWRTVTNPEVVGTRPRPPIYQAPSWSWASLNLSTTQSVPMEATALGSMIDHDVQFADGSEFRQITSGYIRLRGRLTSARFCDSLTELRAESNRANLYFAVALKSDSTEGCVVVKSTIFPDVYVPFRRIWRPDMYPVCDAIGSSHFWMLSLCETDEKVVGLVLDHVGVKGQYRRRGIFEQSKTPEVEFLAFMAHKTSLMTGEYEECFDDGTVTITIV